MACRLDGAKPSSKPVLEYCLLHPLEETSVKSEIKHFQENALENVVRKMAAILSRTQCVNE